jgi:hypothetical protein
MLVGGSWSGEEMTVSDAEHVCLPLTLRKWPLAWSVSVTEPTSEEAAQPAVAPGAAPVIGCWGAWACRRGFGGRLVAPAVRQVSRQPLGIIL